MKPETALAFKKIMERMVKDDKIQAIILGCTELPLLFKNIILPVPTLDTMQIHIAALVEMIMEDEKK